MATKLQTQIIAEPGKQELFIVREFDAERELVFRAFTKPEIMLQFHAPFGTRMEFEKANYYEGGSYRWSHYDADGNLLCTFYGVIHDFTSPERLIQTVEMEGLPERGHVVLEAYLFEDLPGVRTKLTIHDTFRSVADRDQMMESGMEGGVIEIFNKLDKLLAKEF